ncbi:MAG: cytochrome c biogenesis protein CcsA [Lautropia sp.]|nr:cytochrome c biogenesis protein CcsA [Lautropia sp.]
MSIVLILFLSALVLYGLTLFRGLRRDVAAEGPAEPAGKRRIPTSGRDDGERANADPLLGAALVVHAFTLLWPWFTDVFHFGFAYLLSASVWIATMLIWFESRRVGLGRLPTLLAGLAMLVVMLPQIFPGQAFLLDEQAPLFVPHLVVGTLAYGTAFMAALQALLMAAAEHRLHPRRTERAGGGLTALLARGHQSLPPLMVLERILFQVISVAFVLLLLTTLSGAFFSEEIFGKPLPLDHKTVFSLVATVFFGLLLLGRWLWGWRGRLAIRLTLGGFILLLLSYVGSRFVMEVILQRI